MTHSHLCKLLDSILLQDYKTVEVFAINDGSTDNTEEVIKSYIPKYEAKGYSLTYIYQTNQGQSAAINRGLLDFSRSPVTAWNKLVRRELILQNKIFFYEGIIHEDNMWAFWLSKYVQSIAYNYHPTYYYRINPDGITGNKSGKSAKSRLTIIQEELSHLSRERFERKVEIQAILCDLCGYLMKEKVNPVKLIRVSCPTMISLYISNNVKRLGTTAHSMKGLYYRVVHHALNIILINIL